MPLVKDAIIKYLSSLSSGSPFVKNSEEFDPDMKGGLWFGDRNEIFQAYTEESKELAAILEVYGWLLEPYDSSTFMAFPN